MKKIVMTMVALLTMTAAVAQNSDSKETRKAPKQPTAEEVATRMAKDLNLTDAQKDKITALNKEYKDVLGGPGMHRGGPRGPRPDGQTGATQQTQPQKPQKAERPQLTDEQKAQFKKQAEKRKEYDAKLKKILTEEQYKNYQKSKHRHGGHGGHGKHGGPRGQRPDKAQKD